MCNHYLVARPYELKRRAERQAETRRKIIGAAIELHRTKGPARTTLSDIARLAGVQRHTLYRHFPSAWDVGLACSGLYMELNPPPDVEEWRTIADPEERLKRGLGDLYEWFEQVEDMLTRVIRDAEVDPVTREMFQQRAGAWMPAIESALTEDLPSGKRVRAALQLALDLRTWQRLTRGSGLSNAEAVDVMLAAIRCQ